MGSLNFGLVIGNRCSVIHFSGFYHGEVWFLPQSLALAGSFGNLPGSECLLRETDFSSDVTCN